MGSHDFDRRHHESHCVLHLYTTRYPKGFMELAPRPTTKCWHPSVQSNSSMFSANCCWHHTNLDTYANHLVSAHVCQKTGRVDDPLRQWSLLCCMFSYQEQAIGSLPARSDLTWETFNYISGLAVITCRKTDSSVASVLFIRGQSCT